MNTAANHQETVEQFIPNPEGSGRSMTQAILRGASGKRFMVEILGGHHTEVQAGVHYHVNSIIRELNGHDVSFAAPAQQTTEEQTARQDSMATA